MATQILVKFCRYDNDIQHARMLARIIENTGQALPERRFKAKLPGDERALRGIPAIGRNVQGAILGTRPDTRIDSIRPHR